MHGNCLFACCETKKPCVDYRADDLLQIAQNGKANFFDIDEAVIDAHSDGCTGFTVYAKPCMVGTGGTGMPGDGLRLVQTPCQTGVGIAFAGSVDLMAHGKIWVRTVKLDRCKIKQVFDCGI